MYKCLKKAILKISIKQKKILCHQGWTEVIARHEYDMSQQKVLQKCV